MKKLVTFLALAVILIMSGCSAQQTASDNGKPKVYASFYAMYDFARMIGGEHIDLVCMVPPGTEPHDWEPTASDIAALEKADLFVYSGNHMEHWTQSVLPTLSNKALKTVSFGEYNEGDPHAWLSPTLTITYMENIKNALSDVDPQNASVYEDNYLKYSQTALELSHKFMNESRNFKSHEIVVSHEAYAYLCLICGIEQIAIEGLAGESDPSPAKMAEITKQIKDKNIKYIFTEPGESSKTIDTLATETGAEVLTLNPFEFDENGRDYFTVMEENLAALKKALG